MTQPWSYRNDPEVPTFADDKPIIIFDGHCVLCSRFARFILRHDKVARYRLLPAQAPLGHALYVHYGLDPRDYQTNILIENGVAYFKSESSIRMFAGLGFPWSMFGALRLLPLPLRDALYKIVARNRFKWWGRQDVCMLNAPGFEDRFLG